MPRRKQCKTSRYKTPTTAKKMMRYSAIRNMKNVAKIDELLSLAAKEQTVQQQKFEEPREG